MKPSIGRIVHFVNKFYPSGNTPIAAIIVRVWSDTCVNLRLFYDGTNSAPDATSEWEASVTFDESPEPQLRTWHWPPRS